MTKPHPFQIDVLESLGCLSVSAMAGGEPQISLFGHRPSSPLRLRPAGLLDDTSDLVVEPAVDAAVRLGQFIGDKQYSVDFVCQCPCHPDKRL